MKAIVLVIMILVCFNYILKQTFRKRYSVACSAIVCTLFMGLTWPYAIEQSKSQISGWLANSTLMLDIAVILTLEVAVQMAFCILSVQFQNSGTIKSLTIGLYRILRWFPGILIFPVLFSVLVSLVFAMPGTSFPLIAWLSASIVLIAIPGCTYGLRHLLPEKEIRLELLFLSNALIAILGIIATVNGRTAVIGNSNVDWMALAGVCAFVISGLAGGIVLYGIKLKRIIKNNK